MTAKLLPAAVCAALLVSACGSGDDVPFGQAPATISPEISLADSAPPETSPPDTFAVPVTEPAATEPARPNVTGLTTPFLAMDVPNGWVIEQQADSIEATYGNAAWSFDTEVGDTLVAFDFESGGVKFAVLREGRYATVPDLDTWTTGLAGALGVSVSSELSLPFAGTDGNSVLGRAANGSYVRMHTASVSDQYFAAIAISPELPTAALDADVDVMVDSLVFDTSAIPLLAHSIDMKAEASAETTGSTPWQTGMLAPPSWTESDVELQWEDLETGGFAEYFTTPVDADFATMAQRELDEMGTEWLDVDPTIEETLFDDVPTNVYWEGAPGDATAAIVMSHDGVVFSALYVFTPDDPELLAEMVDSIEFAASAFRTDGGVSIGDAGTAVTQGPIAVTIPDGWNISDDVALPPPGDPSIPFDSPTPNHYLILRVDASLDDALATSISFLRESAPATVPDLEAYTNVMISKLFASPQPSPTVQPGIDGFTATDTLGDRTLRLDTWTVDGEYFAAFVFYSEQPGPDVEDATVTAIIDSAVIDTTQF